MSFPRRLPVANRKIDYRLRTRIMGGIMGYTMGCGLVGEYLGWWDNLRPLNPNNPADQVIITQMEDSQTYQSLGLKMNHTLRNTDDMKERSTQIFQNHMPVGLKAYINNDDWDIPKMSEKDREEAEGKWGRVATLGKATILVDDNTPLFQAAREVKPEDLITFTSTKTAVVNEPEESAGAVEKSTEKVVATDESKPRHTTPADKDVAPTGEEVGEVKSKLSYKSPLEEPKS